MGLASLAQLRNYIIKCVVPNSDKFLSLSAYTAAEGQEITGTDSSPLPAGIALTMNVIKITFSKYIRSMKSNYKLSASLHSSLYYLITYTLN